jgi:hypothetical protein
MKTSFKCLASAGALALSCSANAGIVDLFNEGGQIITDTTSGTAWDTLPANLDTGTGVSDGTASSLSSIIGGQRDIWVNCLGGCTNVKTGVLAVDGGELIYSNNPSVTSEAIVQWDGVANPAIADAIELEYALDDGIGSAGFDLTLGGSVNNFEITTLFSDLDWSFRIEAYSGNPTDAANFKSTAITLNATPVGPFEGGLPSPHVSYIPFLAFSACGSIEPDVAVSCTNGGVDLTQLSALQVVLNVIGVNDAGNAVDRPRIAALDLELDQVTTVPEPATIGLFGAGLLALGAMGRRRKEQSLKA